MSGESPTGRLTTGAVVGGVLAVGCCAGLPLFAAAIAAVGGVAFGGIVAVVLLVVLGGLAVIRRRHHGPRVPAQRGAAP